jgi:hypothetical protein
LEDDGAAENFISVQIVVSKEKNNSGTIRVGFFPELNTKNLDISPRSLSVTYSALSNSRFRRYRILKIDFTADFCFWIKLQLNGTQLLGLGLAETPGVPNTIMVASSIIFLMVHNTAPNG